MPSHQPISFTGIDLQVLQVQVTLKLSAPTNHSPKGLRTNNVFELNSLVFWHKDYLTIEYKAVKTNSHDQELRFYYYW